MAGYVEETFDVLKQAAQEPQKTRVCNTNLKLNHVATQILKDQIGRKIGEIRVNGNVQTIHDHTGKKLGEYRVNSNTTHDHIGKKIGTGNLLTSFL